MLQRSLGNGKIVAGKSNKGEIPKARIWLTDELSYRIRGEYLEILGGFRLRIIGWDRRYDSYPNREARLVFRDGEFVLRISKRIPKPVKYIPKGVLALDINERQVVAGNSKIEYRLETAVEKDCIAKDWRRTCRRNIPLQSTKLGQEKALRKELKIFTEKLGT